MSKSLRKDLSVSSLVEVKCIFYQRLIYSKKITLEQNIQKTCQFQCFVYLIVNHFINLKI